MIPTIKTLTKYDIPEPKTVRGLMDGSIDPESFVSVHCPGWRYAAGGGIWHSSKTTFSQCYNLPNRVELALCAINEVINGFGVEGIPDDYSAPAGSLMNHWNEVYGWDSQASISYVNRGDSYAPTIIHNGRRWVVGNIAYVIAGPG